MYKILPILLFALLFAVNIEDEIREGTDKLFEKVRLGKVKIEIFKKYKLEDAVQAHKDLEARKITGPAIIIP